MTTRAPILSLREMPEVMTATDLAVLHRMSKSWADEQLAANAFPHVRRGKRIFVYKRALSLMMSGKLGRNPAGEWVPVATEPATP